MTHHEILQVLGNAEYLEEELLDNQLDDDDPSWQPIRAPVGGITTPINKIEILTPYLALAGLIAAVTAAFTIRKRRKD